MKTLPAQPKLVEQVYDAILSEISEGKLPLGARIIQEQIAAELGVSRQPVQQALLLLRNQGILRDAPGRGLIVAPMDLEHVRNLYEIRAVLEGYACRRAAELNAARARRAGPALIAAGREAVRSGSIARMIDADVRFHELVHELSANPLIEHATESHWVYMRRVMGEVLMRDERPRDIWDQHERILQAIVAGDGDAAEREARRHVLQAAQFMIARLRGQAPAEDGTGAPAPKAPAPKAEAPPAAVPKAPASKTLVPRLPASKTPAPKARRAPARAAATRARRPRERAA